MKTLRSFKVKLKTTEEQRKFFLESFDTKRFLINTALGYKKGYWEHLHKHFPRIKETVKVKNKKTGKIEKKTIEISYSPELEEIYQAEKKKYYRETSYESLAKLFSKKEIEKWNIEWLNPISAECVQQGLKDLDKAFTNFFKGKSDFPTFKKKHSPNHSLRYVMACNIVKLNKKTLGVKIGAMIIPAKIPLNNSKFLFDGSIKVKNITISQDSCGDLYSSICYEMDVLEVSNKNQTSIGIDMGVRTFASLSSKKNIFARKEYKLSKSIDKLITKRQRLQKKNKIKGKITKKGKVRTIGSVKYLKTKKQISKLYKKEKNIRDDFQNKVVDEITKKHGIICREDLRIKNMSKSAKGNSEKHGKNVAQKSGLNREIRKQGWGSFFIKLENKAIERGCIVIKVAPQKTSQTCSKCNHIDSESRDGKLFCCTKCGFEVDADFNGANNIETRGLRGIAEGDESLDLSMNSELEKPLVVTPEESLTFVKHSAH